MSKIITTDDGRRWIRCTCGEILPQDCDLGKDWCRRCEHECKK
jgi:hypothetical protein